MIKIDKDKIPDKFEKISNRLTQQLKQRYMMGERDFKFSKAYRSDEVKDSLRECHHNKCCYSEAKFVGDDANVEHFRPKAKIDEWPNGTSLFPGYYWLAYDWSNLLLCKRTINCSYKRNFFPLELESSRNYNHLDNKIELPLLVDPSIEDPREHIRFRDYEPIALTERGRVSIELLRLTHSDFFEARFAKFKIIKLLKKKVDEALEKGITKNEPTVADVIQELRAFIQPEAEFSSMAIDLLQDWPPLQSDLDLSQNP